MRSFAPWALSLLGVVAVATAADAEAQGPSDVHQLTKDTFDAFMKEHPLVLAEFFAPWCGHCKALAPKYEEAATELKEKNIALVKVDCTEEVDLCQEQGVSGYPTLKVFRGLEDPKPYGGARQTDAIVSYMVKQSLPAVSIVTAENLTETKDLDKVVVVAYIAEDDTASKEAFTSFAESQRDNYLFALGSNPDLAKSEEVEQPSIVLYKNFDDRKAVYDGKLESEALLSWVKSASTPLVGEVGPETYSGYMTAGIPLAYIFAETKEEREKFAEDFKPIAQKLKGSINIATIDAKAFGAHAGNLNLDPEKFPSFAIQDPVKNTKYPYDQTKKVDAKEIEKFIKDVVDGKVEPSIKSEPIPETQPGPVQVVVAHSYQDIVINNDKDVLLEFYAPWCGHCKALAPKYEELAELYAKNPEVVIAKIDATANDVPDSITGFPTIKLFPAGSKDAPVEYSGSRSIEDLADFIKENGKYGIDVKPAAPEETSEETPEEAPEETPEEAAEEAAEATETNAASDEAEPSATGEGKGHDEL